jgi:glycosyltransferase involved in cell wall biosynthesis
MRVLYVNALYPPHVGGGAEVALAAIVQGFRERGQDAAVLTTHASAGVLREQVDGVPVLRIGQRNVYWHHPPQDRPGWARALWHAIDSYNLPMAHQAGAVIDEVGPDLIVCHNLAGLSAAIWGAAGRRRIPLVQVLHDYYSLCPRVSMFRDGRACARPCAGCSLFRMPHPRASRAVSAVVGVSQAVLDTHLAHGLFAGVGIKAVVHNGRSLPALPGRGEADAGDVPGPFTVGYIGALTEIKGVHELAGAFRRAAASSVRAMQLLIAGSGKPEFVVQLRQAHESDHVRFVGQVEPTSFFSGLDVCVVPSLWNEPLGMVAFEAIACGVPVIGARRGGIPEIVQHGVNGLLYEPDEPGALERALARVIDEPALLPALRAAGRASVARFLNPQRMLDECEAIYRRVLHGTPDPAGDVAGHAASAGSVAGPLPANRD